MNLLLLNQKKIETRFSFRITIISWVLGSTVISIGLFTFHIFHKGSPDNRNKKKLPHFPHPNTPAFDYHIQILSSSKSCEN